MKLRVDFNVEAETHNLTDFQTKGHFVPGMTDAEQRRRKWEGNAVHTLELKHNGLQVLRVVADSQAEAERLMELNIMGTLLAHAMAQKGTEFSYDQMKRLVDRVATLQEFIDTKMKLNGEDSPAFADAFQAAIFYMDRLAGRVAVLRQIIEAHKLQGA